MFALLKLAQTHCSWIADFIKDSIPPPPQSWTMIVKFKLHELNASI